MIKDLIVLAADKDLEHALLGLFSQPKRLGVRPIKADIRIHPEHDPACALHGVEFLSSFSPHYEHGLLMFDHEGSGQEKKSREEIQEALNKDLGRLWGNRARAIVLLPELESWVWSGSPHVDHVAGWKGRRPKLRDWLEEQDLLRKGEVKPDRPKEAFQAALRAAGTPRSASLYRQIAEKVSLRRCQDPSFREFRGIMQEWFPKG